VRRLRIIAGVALAAVALAACGESPEDQARDDGKEIGEAVRTLVDSQSIQEAQDAIGQIRSAVAGMDGDTRERVQEQINTQRDVLSGAVDDARSATSFEEAKTDLTGAAQQMRSQAESFQNGAHSVANEFWRGFQEGYDGD
jgi:hypothetical protein